MQGLGADLRIVFDSQGSDNMRSEYTPITLEPRPSRWQRRVLRLLQLVTLAVLLAAALPGTLKILLLCLALLFCLQQAQQLRTRSTRCIIRVRLDQAGSARLEFADGRSLDSRLRGDSILCQGVMVLHFDGPAPHRRLSLVLDDDSLSADELRCLRVLLRGYRATAGKTEPL